MSNQTSESRRRALISRLLVLIGTWRDRAFGKSELWARAAAELEAALAEGMPPAEPGVPGSEVLCEACAKVFCPHGERLHFHHDGCPACGDDEPGSARVPPAELQTECCDVSIATDSRFCPKCGWEARVKSASVPSEPSPEPPNQPIWQQFYDLTTWLLSEAPTARIDLGATQGYHDAMLVLTNFRANLRLDDSVTHNESWWHRGRKLASSWNDESAGLLAQQRATFDSENAAAEKRVALDALAIISDPKKWMRWCDVRVLERCETLEAALAAANDELRQLRLLVYPENIAQDKTSESR